MASPTPLANSVLFRRNSRGQPKENSCPKYNSSLIMSYLLFMKIYLSILRFMHFLSIRRITLRVFVYEYLRCIRNLIIGSPRTFCSHSMIILLPVYVQFYSLNEYCRRNISICLVSVFKTRNIVEMCVRSMN